MTYEQGVLVQRLKVALADIRKIAGWSGVELGNMLGLSRQAINTLEKPQGNGGSAMTLAQFIAIRHLLDAWMEMHPENKTLPRVITLAVDDRRIFGHKYTELLEVVKTIAATASGGADTAVTDAIAKVLLDEWEAPAREYCYAQLKKEMIAEKVGVTIDTEPGNWTELIISARTTNGSKR